MESFPNPGGDTKHLLLNRLEGRVLVRCSQPALESFQILPTLGTMTKEHKEYREHKELHHQPGYQGQDIVLVIQPTLLFGISSHFQHRPLDCPNRCIGAILGTRDQHEHVYDAVHSFPVLHEEHADQIAINCDYFRTRLAQHREIHGKRSTLLGWFSVNAGHGVADEASAQPLIGTDLFDANTFFINEFFALEVRDSTTGQWSTSPPCVCLQMSIDDIKGISVKAFVNGRASSEDGAYNLQPIEHVVQSHDLAESRLVAALRKHTNPANPLAPIPLSVLRSIQAEEQAEFTDKLHRLAAHRQQHADDSATGQLIDAVASLLPDPAVLAIYNAHIDDDKRIFAEQLDLLLSALNSCTTSS